MWRQFCFSIFTAMFISSPASADPFRIQDVTQELENAGVEQISQAILYGQPMISGRIKRFGFNAGLRECSRLNGDEDLYCMEAAFKACVRILPGYERIELLELSNRYNQSRRTGYLVLDENPNMGTLLCVHTLNDFRDENIFSYDEVVLWEQAVEDFRSFLAHEEVKLVDPSQL